MQEFVIFGSSVKGMTYMGNNLPVVQLEVFGKEHKGKIDMDPLEAVSFASKLLEQSQVSLHESAMIHVLAERGTPPDDVNDIIIAIDRRKAELGAYLVGLRNDRTEPEEGPDLRVILPDDG